MLEIGTTTFDTDGALAHKGAGTVLLVNRDATDAIFVATSLAALGAGATRDAIPAGESVAIEMSGRNDQLFVAASAGTTPVAVYVSA